MTAPHCLLEVKVSPNAPRSAIAGWLGTALKVKVKAPVAKKQCVGGYRK